MPLLLSMALAASVSMVPVCSWDEPGHRPFMGDVVAAVDHYGDIPLGIRDKLKKRMSARQYDEVASIERDAIKGKFSYAPEIREMHFANGQLCKEVSRKKWLPQATERGLVYCESGHCIIVPTVCRNVARITRLSTRVAGDELLADPRSANAAPPPVKVLVDGAGLTSAAPSLEQLARLAPSADAAVPAAPTTTSVLGPVDKVAGDQLTTLPSEAAAQVDKSWAGEVGNDANLFDNLVPGSNGPTRLSPVTQVSEPAMFWLWALGLAGMGWFVRRRNSIFRN